MQTPATTAPATNGWAQQEAKIASQHFPIQEKKAVKHLSTQVGTTKYTITCTIGTWMQSNSIRGLGLYKTCWQLYAYTQEFTNARIHVAHVNQVAIKCAHWKHQSYNFT